MSVSEANPALRVVLLARPGKARDRLREALAHADVQLALEEDPTTLELHALQAACAQAVVVALEPAIEDALERLDPVLSSPELTLVFDEAEVAARRDGWDAQRLGRHLAAKLHGHQQVLPPGAEEEAALPPQPALAPAQASSGDELYTPPATLSEPVSLEEALAALQPAMAAAAEPPLPGQADGVIEHGAVVLLDAEPAPPVVSFGDHTRWALVDDDAAPAAAPAPAPAAAAVPTSPGDGLSLLDLQGPVDPAGAGAVLLLAGIGGPDAVRRLLAALPAGLSVPVLVHLRLDGGRYGNLVKQMARVSPLPVLLAEAGQIAVAGQVHILADEIGLRVDDDGLRFHAGSEGLQLSTLVAAHSAVVLLSGADLGYVDAALDLAAAGAWVAGQSGDGCYDPAAAIAVVAAGMAAGEPQELAQVIAARWAATEGDAA